MARIKLIIMHYLTDGERKILLKILIFFFFFLLFMPLLTAPIVNNSHI